MLTKFEDLKAGDVIVDSNFKYRERYSWFNTRLDRLEICPTRAIKVHNEESFKTCFAAGKEIEDSAGEAEYQIRKKGKIISHIYAYRLPEKKERIKITKSKFPQIKVLRNEKLKKNLKKKKELGVHPNWMDYAFTGREEVIVV